MIRFYQSTIGKKIVVAVTGVILFGFLVGHLLGNLQVFVGPEKINAYAAFLKETLPLLWGTRIVLLAAAVLHVVNTLQLTFRNRQSRPVAYAKHEMIRATKSSRWMVLSGLFLLGYIVYHLLDFTFGTVHSQFVEGDVYANIINGFSVTYKSVFYIVAMIFLGLHLHHGLFSLFQTLGMNHPKYNQCRKLFAAGASIVIALGYISIPVAVLFGVLHL